MPKKVMDYSKCVIYKLVCNDLTVTDCYVGHTTNFTQRKKHHKDSTNIINNQKYNRKTYDFIRDNGGWDNFSMIEIEKYPCKDHNEATARERYWYEILTAKLNTNIPNRSKKEWYEANKEKIKEKSKEYYDTNKEKLLTKQKEYYDTNKEKINKKFTCECGSICCITYKQRHFKTPKHKDFISSNNINETTTETEEIKSI